MIHATLCEMPVSLNLAGFKPPSVTAHLFDAPAPWAAAMHCVATAAVCLAATSSFLMALFLRALEAAALVTALGRGRGRGREGEGEGEGE